MFGMSMGRMGAVGGVFPFSPSKLFTTGVNGAWYDPSDINLNWRRNLLTYSEQFDNAAWTKSGSGITANTAVAPDGTLTADKFTPTADASTHSIYATGSYPAASTISIFAKPNGYNYAFIVFYDGVFRVATFDLVNGVVSQNPSVGSATVTQGNNGYWRCSVTTGANVSSYIYFGSNPTATTTYGPTMYVGDGTSGIYIWGAQLELGSTATTYQKITDGVQDYLQYQAQPVLYQNAAGTLPVTAVEQPVGLMLDKSKNGVGTNGAKRVNLLTYTEQFDNAAWIKSASTAPSVSVTNPVGGALANKLTEDTSNATHTAGQYISATAGTYKIIVYAKQAGRQRFAFVFQDSSKNNGCYAVINLNTANVDVPATLFGTGFSSGSASAVSVGNGWVLCTLTVNAPATTLGLACSLDNATSGPLSQTYLGDGTSGIYIWGADLRLASEAATLPTYQKITDTWYNTLPGNHAFNSSGNSANFPVLSARVNLLTKTEQFDDAVWVKSNVTVTANAVIAPDGTMSADLVYPATTGTGRTVYQNFSLVAGVYSISFAAKASGKRWAAIDGTNTTAAAYFDLQNGVVGTVTAGHTASMSPLGDGWYRCTVTNTSGGGVGYFAIRPVDLNGTESVTANGTDGIYIWGADLRVANDALNQPAYQRVNTATDYDTVGFKPYLRFNGTNQWLQTNSIDFTYGDKMFVSAGVRKLSDADAIILELSQSFTYQGAFYFASQSLGRFGAASRGTATAGAAQEGYVSGYYAPVTAIPSALYDIPSDLSVMRVNGTVGTNGTGDQGTGNYGNYPIYIGARAGSSLWFNGRLYQMVVTGKQASAAEITSTETYINQKTGAF